VGGDDSKLEYGVIPYYGMRLMSTLAAPTTSLRIVSPVPLRQQVAAQLRSALAEGVYLPGQRLLERDLCEASGVSRTSVREALRELEAEGLVSVIPNRGPIVAPLTMKTAEDIYDAREALEPHVARLYVRNAGAAHDKTMQGLMRTLEGAYGQAPSPAFLRAKSALYAHLVSTAGNEVIAGALRGIHIRAMQLRSLGIEQAGRKDASLQVVRRLAAALLQRDADRAAAVSLEHVRGAAAAGLAALRAHMARMQATETRQ
jgi:DNA-binding GntR family transcriptional regulator